MKKLYFSALAIICGLGLNAQITQANQAPTNGDLFSQYQVDSTFVPGSATASTSWSYAIIVHTSIANNYTAATSNNTLFAPADVAVASTTSNITYYKASATELKNTGGILSINGAAGQIIYTSPYVAMPYPATFNTTSTTATGGSISVLGQNGTFTGTAVLLIDGTGTLALPARTFSNVIRAVMSQTIYFVTGIASGTITQKTYDWYSLADSKYPILTYKASSIIAPPLLATASTETLANVQKNYQTVGIKEIGVKEEVSLNVYPNPSNTTVNFATENVNAKSISIYDVTGKMVENVVLNNGKTVLNVTNYNNGVYIYKMINASNGVLKTGKITVTH